MPTPSATAPSVSANRSMRGDAGQFIETQIHRTGGALKLVDLLAHLMIVCLGLGGILLVAALLEHWLIPGGFGTLGRSVVFVGILAAGGWYVYRQIAPMLLRHVNPVFAAQAIEQHSPGLKNSLLNLLLLKREQNQLPATVLETVERQAATGLANADVESAVDRSTLIRLGYVLVGLVLVAGIYKILSPKDPVASAGRILMPWADIPAPTRVELRDMQPGEDVYVSRGQQVEVSLSVAGMRVDETVVMHYSTADGQAVNRQVQMHHDARRNVYHASLPPTESSGGVSGVQQEMTYFITAGDARSKRLTIHVTDEPTLLLQKQVLEYLPYTGLRDRTITHNGHIRAIEGTRVTLFAVANHPIRRAGIDLDADGNLDIKMRSEQNDPRRAAGSMVLTLDEATRMQPHNFYALRFTNDAGQENEHPAKYRMEVIRDFKPEVDLISPESAEVEVELGKSIDLEVQAFDPDYALSRVAILGEVSEKQVFEQVMIEQEHVGRYRSNFTFSASAERFAVGDVVEYWAEAYDNRQVRDPANGEPIPEPNKSVSQRRRLKIVAPPASDEAKHEPQQPGQQEQDQQQPPQNADQQHQGDGDGEQRQGQQDQAGAANQQQPAENQTAEGQQQQGDATAGDGGQPQQNPANSDSQADGQQQEGPQQNDAQGNAGAQQQESANGSENQNDTGQQGGTNDQQQGNPGQQVENGQSGQGRQSNSAGGPQQQGGSPNAQPPGAESEPSPVPADGSDDAEAFRRLNDHFQQQEQSAQPKEPNPQSDRQDGTPGDFSANEQNQQQSEQNVDGQTPDASDQTQQRGGTDAADGQSQQDAATRQEGQQGNDNGNSAQQEPSRPNQQAQADQANADSDSQNQQRQDNTADNSQPPADRAQDPQSQPGDGGETGDEIPSQQKQQQEQPSEGDPSKQSPKSAGSNQSQGTAGEGQKDDSNTGTPAADQRQKPAQKQQPSPTEQQQQENADPAAQAQGNHESDSQSDQSGDQSGGGRDGGGQKAPREGTGSPGQNTAADDGAGTSDQQGPGADAHAPGAAKQSDDPTGAQGEKPGKGSTQRDGGNQTGNADESSAQQKNRQPQDDDPQQNGNDDGQVADRPSENGQPDQPAEQNQGENRDGGKPGSPGDQAGNPNHQQDERRGDPSNAGGNSGANDGQLPPDRRATPPPAGDESNIVGDEANLEYARKQTDLMLEKLEDQLNSKKVDQEILDKMGWTEQQLKQFVDRWKDLKQQAKRDAAQGTAQRELDEALRSLGLRQRQTRRQAGTEKSDDLRDLRDAVRAAVPVELQEEVGAYTRGISRQQ